VELAKLFKRPTSKTEEENTRKSSVKNFYGLNLTAPQV
jgi:hypothetical protein